MAYENMKFDGDIQVQDTRKRIAIRDNDNNIIGVAVFDPSDIVGYRKLIDFSKSLEGIYTLAKGVDNKKIAIPQSETAETLEHEFKIEDFSKFNDIFVEITNFTDELKAAVDAAMITLDAIFGEGIAKTILNDGYDFNKISPLIQAAMPFYEKARHDKVSLYKRTEKQGVMQ